MSTERYMMKIEGLRVDIKRKPIKNLHLSVYPPDGQVRVSAPEYLDDEAIRLAVIDKLGWIRRQQAKFQTQPRQSQREMVSGESHYFQGRRYLLEIEEINAPPVVWVKHHKLVLRVRPGTNRDKREAILYRWYRHQLKMLIPSLIVKWEAVIGVHIADWGVKRMKTRWGTCNIEARRIWLNLELVKKPPRCLEYVLVHEMVHLLERHHNERFRTLMDRFLPQWRLYRDELNSEPLAHEHWVY